MKNSDQTAFPIVGSAFSNNYKGLTKREYFAAMAMQGILSNPSETDVTSTHIRNVLELPSDVVIVLIY